MGNTSFFIILIKLPTLNLPIKSHLSLKECSNKTFSIFWKNAHMKKEDFFMIFFSMSNGLHFWFYKSMNPRLYIFFWLINPWRKIWTYVLKYEVNLLNKCFDHFSNLIKFWFSERNTENAMSDIYFNGEIDYSEENTSDNEDFRSTIFQRLQFEPEQKKMWCNESHEEEIKDIHASDVDLLHINRKSRPVQMWTLQKRSERKRLSLS